MHRLRPMNRLIWGFVLFLWLSGRSVSAITNSPVRALGIVRTYGESAEIFDHAVNLSDLDRGVGYFLLHTIQNCRSNAAALLRQFWIVMAETDRPDSQRKST